MIQRNTQFSSKDVIRHKIVKDIIDAYNRAYSTNSEND